MSEYDEKSSSDLQDEVEVKRTRSGRSRKDVNQKSIDRKPASDTPVESRDAEETLPAPATLYAPVAWKDGDLVKVAFRFSGRVTAAKAEYFSEQTRLHAKHLGATVLGEPGLLLAQGGTTLYGVSTI